MQRKQILVPVDLAKAERSYDALQFVGGMAGDLQVHATLLYVINTNPATPGRELIDPYEGTFKALAGRFLADCITKRFRLRAGKPHEQIVLEAEEQSLELIVLSRPNSSRWNWFRSRTAERVIRSAPCLTLVLPAVWNITPAQYRLAMSPLSADFAN